MTHRRLTCTLLLLLATLTLAAPQPPVVTTDSLRETVSLDFKDVDIRDAIRAISKQNNLNIILDTNVTGKVTLHLTNVPVLEGLRSLADPIGLEVVKDGRFYRIRKKVDEEKSIIRFVNDLLTIDVQNVDVRAFLQELSSRTAISIVPDNKVTGKISGKLNQVSLDDGLRAILEGNGYNVSRHRNIYQVTMSEAATASSPMAPRASRFRQSNTGKSDFFVDYANGKLTIEVTNGDLEDIIKAIADQTGAQIVTYGSVKSEVNAKLYDASIRDAFNLLLRGTRFTFVIKDSVILIGDRNAATPSGQALSTSELIPLRHIKADAVPPILPYNIPASNIKVIKEQNALLVSGSSDDIEMVRDFLRTIDLPTPQVRIDVVIVEYTDNIKQELGFNYWGHRPDLQSGSYKLIPSPETKVDKGSNATEVGVSGEQIVDFLKRSLGLADGTILAKIPADFFAIIRVLESHNKARVLGQPSIMTLNGYKATINVDQTQYFEFTTGTLENQTTRFQPIKFGIQLSITPWIASGGQIIAEISPEVSNSDQTNSKGYPDVSTRAMTTTARLTDGQTLALGGLTKNKESEGVSKVPFLGDIPIIGALFRYKNKSREKTNLVIYITPHIVTPSDTISISEELRKYTVSSRSPLETRVLNAMDRLNPADESMVDSSGEIESATEKNRKLTPVANTRTRANKNPAVASEENGILLDSASTPAPKSEVIAPQKNSAPQKLNE